MQVAGVAKLQQKTIYLIQLRSENLARFSDFDLVEPQTDNICYSHFRRSLSGAYL